MTIYSRSSPKNVNNWRSWIKENNALLSLINEQNSDNPIDKIYMNAKDLNELKYQLLIKKREDGGIKHLNDPKAFTE